VVFLRVRPFSLMGVDFGHCVDGSRWFFGSMAIFFNGVDFEHGVGGFGWFLGS
jgi:hypothetical protein